jgi:hypothetical protein
MAVGATPGKDDKAYAVSDSEDEDLAVGDGRCGTPASRSSTLHMQHRTAAECGCRAFSSTGWAKPQEITDAICEALKRNFVFKGISDSLLLEVVERMHGVCFKAGSVVLQQAALPKPDDCMYFLQSGEAEVVISGAPNCPCCRF